jgi:predicted dehydrogenase
MIRDNGCEYDRLCLASLKTEGGLVGDVIQDVVTRPAEKSLRIQGRDGFLEWHVNYQPDTDAVIAGSGAAVDTTRLIAKTRADDFKAEVAHLEEVLSGKVRNSPLALERGLDTQMVIAAIFRSHATGRRVTINWNRGYRPEALG